MGKPLKMDSLITDPKKENGKFEVTLNKEVFNHLIKYLVLGGESTKRNEFIESLIADKLKDNVLDNDYINLKPNDYFYINKNELLKEKSIVASNDLIKRDLEEIFVVKSIPNNLDEFDQDLKTYCDKGNKYKHAGVHILPKYKEYEEKIFSFEYDSQERYLKIELISKKDLEILLNNNHKLYKSLTFGSMSNTVHLERGEYSPLHIPFVMYSYHLNEYLEEVKQKEENGEIEKKSIDDKDPIFYKGIFF